MQKWNRCLFIGRESQASLCPGRSLSSYKQIHLLTLDNHIAQDKEPQQQHANPIWIWGAQRVSVKIFTAKGEMAWNCFCHIIFFISIEISIFFLLPSPGWWEKSSYLWFCDICAWGLEKGQCHSNLQKGQERGPRELQVGQPHLHPGKGDGGTYPGGHYQASGGKEGYQE